MNTSDALNFVHPPSLVLPPIPTLGQINSFINKDILKEYLHVASYSHGMRVRNTAW